MMPLTSLFPCSALAPSSGLLFVAPELFDDPHSDPARLLSFRFVESVRSIFLLIRSAVVLITQRQIQSSQLWVDILLAYIAFYTVDSLASSQSQYHRYHIIITSSLTGATHDSRVGLTHSLKQIYIKIL